MILLMEIAAKLSERICCWMQCIVTAYMMKSAFEFMQIEITYSILNNKTVFQNSE